MFYHNVCHANSGHLYAYNLVDDPPSPLVFSKRLMSKEKQQLVSQELRTQIPWHTGIHVLFYAK